MYLTNPTSGQKPNAHFISLLGPTLRAEEGETLVVTFRNLAHGAYSLHPHGVAYGKQSEGANYFDNTSQKEKEDDVVLPNTEHVYHWEATADVSPQPNDPACLTHTYISHVNVVEDYNSGLVGALLICKAGSLDESGKQVQVHHELVFLFGVFDDKASKYKPSSDDSDNHVKYTINGYSRGTLPDVSVCAHASVSLHLLGMSSQPEVFSVHMNGQVLTQAGHRVSSVGLISGSTATASMVAIHTGRWLLSSHTIKHMEVGMHAFVDVKKCDNFKAPRRRLTIAQKRESKEWKYYIAAEEIEWDYAPNEHEHIDQDFRLEYLKQSPTRIGKKYKKAVYTLYKNESFTEMMESKQRRNELGILGPVIRAQIHDVITIVFKNMASIPYSIYPHGLTIEKSEEGVNYPRRGNHSHGVLPGETHTYVWRVMAEDEPLEADPRCLTRMYHSAVNTPRDISSGLIGPILICKSQSLNVRNVQLRADKEQHAMFAVFDENKSWYLEENIRQYSDPSKVNMKDLDFYKSNVMHTINGYVFESGPLLGFCNGEVATWHVSSVGAQDYIQTATFYGHTFELNEQLEDFLSLYPMTGETISMNMENIGVWLLASLNSHETTKGMRVKFQDVECYRDYAYEYDYEGPTVKKEYNVWKPPSIDEVKKEEEEPKPVNKPTGETDVYTLLFAEELGLRSLKNQSGTTDVENLDLTFLDYDAIDVPDENSNITNKFVKENDKANWTVVLQPDVENLTNMVEVDGNNRTVKFQDQNTTIIPSVLIGQNTTSSSPIVIPSPHNVTVNGRNITEVHNVSASPKNINLNETLPEGINFTGFLRNYAKIMQVFEDIMFKEKAQNASTLTNNIAASANLSLGNVTLSGALNTTAQNATASSLTGNASTELNSPTNTSKENAIHTGTQAETWTTINEVEMENVTMTGDNHTSENKSFVEEEKVSRGDVFAEPFYPSKDNLENWTLSINDFVGSLLERHNITLKPMVELSNNKTDVDSSIKDLENGFQMSSFESVGHSLHNNLSDMAMSLKSDPDSSRSSLVNLTVVFDASSNESVSKENGNLSFLDSTELLSALESSEEILIYLQDNITEAIKTTSLKTQGHNWTYEGSHQTVPAEIPEQMKKYFEDETISTTIAPKKKVRKVNLRKRPQKGQGLKTRKRKEYKPQSRSGQPFSPRGFHPGMSPRGSRPVSPQPISDEEDLVNMPVVIGVPRPDFSDYELYVPGGEPDHLGLDEQDVKANEYEYVMYKDPYSNHEDIKNLNLDETAKYYLKLLGPNIKTYFITAEEVEWDYAGYGSRRHDKSQQNLQNTKFTKVVFRGYMDGSFHTPDVRGEVEEHLGLLGPVIKAEVGQDIMVVFKNKASRPYSLHPNGVSYTKQTEGLSYEDGSKYWYKYDNEVQPNSTFTYLWKVGEMVGPKPGESDCRTWAYYSGVNPERDIHSGLIGPLLVCRKGTLETKTQDMREFTLLFMVFDESQSWYYEKNRETMQRKSRRKILDPDFKENLKFHTINGIIFSLKGLRMYTNQRVCWHLINMGSPTDMHSVHFHGQTFIIKKTSSYRQAVFPLLPGGFATLEMYPSKPGLWQLETEVGYSQQKGMQTLFLVLDNNCDHPLGLQSSSVHDNQITAINSRGTYWEPHLARLNNKGRYNAWSTETNNSWIQVDFQRPVVISQVATQGAKEMFQSVFVSKYSISYSLDRRKWIFYKGDSRDFRKVFIGNQDAYETKTNTFFPPLVGRFIRLHPITWNKMATVRMEFYGCELDGCSVPLGMESGQIEDRRITASSTFTNWYSRSWKPSLARLNKQGTINAWQAKYNDMNQWLQVELPQVKKITGIITQGAKSLGSEMYVVSYILQYSDNGVQWSDYNDDEEIQSYRMFKGNMDNNDHVRNYIYPPIFSRFIRIVPKSWMGSITLRMELLGCDFE
uniref:ferroxidase n=1 Tax=Gouania willdenowi TaxID=441366 RepID=A0A8C5N8D4_GOUWI